MSVAPSTEVVKPAVPGYQVVTAPTNRCFGTLHDKFTLLIIDFLDECDIKRFATLCGTFRAVRITQLNLRFVLVGNRLLPIVKALIKAEHVFKNGITDHLEAYCKILEQPGYPFQYKGQYTLVRHFFCQYLLIAPYQNLVFGNLKDALKRGEKLDQLKALNDPVLSPLIKLVELQHKAKIVWGTGSESDAKALASWSTAVLEQFDDKQNVCKLIPHLINAMRVSSDAVLPKPVRALQLRAGHAVARELLKINFIEGAELLFYMLTRNKLSPTYLNSRYAAYVIHDFIKDVKQTLLEVEATKNKKLSSFVRSICVEVCVTKMDFEQACKLGKTLERADVEEAGYGWVVRLARQDARTLQSGQNVDLNRYKHLFNFLASKHDDAVQVVLNFTNLIICGFHEEGVRIEESLIRDHAKKVIAFAKQYAQENHLSNIEDVKNLLS